jgi:DNA-binding MarR family transcriptional regulator
VDSAKCAEIAAGCACATLRKASRAVTQLYDEALRPSGLRATQLPLLVAAQLLGGVAVTRLARELGLDRTTLTRNLRPLVRRNLLQVQAGRDGRTHVVALTADGRRALSRAIPLWERAQAKMAARLGAGRLKRLLGDVARVAGGLESVGEGRASQPLGGDDHAR